MGKWERRTERERIGGTNSRRSDFDESRLAEEYDPEYQGEEKLGAYTAQVLTLKGKPGLDLAFPVIKLWVDKETNNILKRQEFALSGRLLRTSYYPKWKKLYSESKKADVWYPQEMRFYDEVEKAELDPDPDQDGRPQAAASPTSSPRRGWRANRDEGGRGVGIGAGAGRSAAAPAWAQAAAHGVGIFGRSRSEQKPAQPERQPPAEPPAKPEEKPAAEDRSRPRRPKPPAEEKPAAPSDAAEPQATDTAEAE